jgi:hypothetical protein
MKKGLFILLAILGIAIFFMTKNMKNSLKAKKDSQNEKIYLITPTISPSKTSQIDQPNIKSKQTVENSKEEEEYEEYEPDVPNQHNQPHSTDANLNPNFHKSTETAPIAVTPPPAVQHSTPAPVTPGYIQPPAPPVEKLAPLLVKP